MYQGETVPSIELLVIRKTVRALGAVRELVGDHVEHNTYVRDFPAGVPDAIEFWVTYLRDAIEKARSRPWWPTASSSSGAAWR